VNLIAFDLSLTSTGWADAEECGTLCPPKNFFGVKRLRWIRDQVLELARGADLVVIEGYAFARPNQAHQIGELGGVIRLALSDAGLRWVEIAPASLKKFAAGKGNAKKEEVFAAAIRKLRYAGNSFDEADALFLLQMARTHYAGPEVIGAIATVYEREALAGVEWPKIAQPVPA
jgi:crossover junction endodeoxyribonuclease RuvC